MNNLEWTTCENCGDRVPAIDAEEGICILCWEVRAFGERYREDDPSVEFEPTIEESY